jgi:hypothetical protein
MRISKWRRPWLGLALAGCAMPLSAQTAPPVEGVYQDQVFEVGSQLILAPDGRFLWMLAYGSLDAMGEGRWTRESDGSILLDSDPPVVPPRMELVGRSRDNRPGIAIRLACDSLQAAQVTRALVDYADGSTFAHNFDSAEVRTDANRPVTAITVGSEIFGLQSERIPVNAEEANVFTFRFIANDFGRADFRNQRVAVANGALSFTWRGMELRYTREGTAAGQDLPRLPPVPGSGGDAAPAALEVSIGEPLEGLQARAGQALTGPPGEGLLVARGPIDLKLDYDGHDIDLGRVEGGRQPLIVATGGGEGRVESVTFSYQPAPFALDAALARAQSLKTWLEAAGFGLLPGADRLGDPPAFSTRPSDGNDGVHAADWADAARMLADEAQGIAAMELYTVRSRSHMASVRLENVRRHEREVCAHSEWSGAPGQEWRLLVTISPSLAPVPE